MKFYSCEFQFFFFFLKFKHDQEVWKCKTNKYKRLNVTDNWVYIVLAIFDENVRLGTFNVELV